MPLLETDALTIRSTFDSLPDEAKPLASDWMKRYKDQQDEFGLPLFPSEVETQQADESAFVSMFDDVKLVDPGNGIYDQAERLKSGEGDRLRQREAGMRFLAKHGDEEKVRRDFPLYRDDFAMKNGGKRDMGDGEFYSFVSQQVKRQQGQKLVRSRSLDAGFRAAIEGMGSLEKLAAVKNEAAASADNEVDAGAFLEAYGETQKVMSKHSAFIREYSHAIMANMDGGSINLEPLNERLLDMPGTERRMVIAALNLEAQKQGKKVKADKGDGYGKALSQMLQGAFMGASEEGSKFWQQTGEAAGRLARSAAIDQPRIERLIASIPDTGKVLAPSEIKTAKDAQAYVREALVRSDVAEASAMAAGTGGVGALPVDDNRTTITLDETAQRLIQDAKEREMKRLRVANEIRSIGEAADPIPNVFASTIGTSGAALALMAGTRGLAAPALANAYTNIEFNDLSLKYPQMSTADKTQIAAISGAAQAALDYVDVKALDKLPGIKSLIAQPLTKQLAGRALARGALSYATENIVEAGQDAATPLLLALKQDVPGYDWRKEFDEFLGQRVDVAIGLLPLTLLGIGAASVNEYRGAKNLLSWNDQLGAAGVVETDRVAVIEAAQSGDMGKAQSLLMEAWGRRNPEVAAEYQDAMSQRQTDMSRATAELERLGAIPTLRRDGEGWTVTSNGTSTKFATWEEARDVATAAMGDMERAQTELVASLSDSFMASTPGFLKGESVEFNTDAKGESLVDRVNAGAMTPEQAMEAAVAGGVIKGVTMQEARAIAAEVFGGQNASERAMQFRQDVEKIAVLGRNTVQNGQSRSIVNAAGNERSFLTVVEEVVEGRWKGGLERRAFTKDMGIRWVQLAEAATGEKFLEGSTWEEIAASAELAPRALTEAISRIVVADVLGRMKDGKRIGPGTVSSGLNLNDREQSALAAILDAFRKLFRALLETASKLAKARQEGKLGGEYDALFDALTGGSSQLEHDAGAAKEADAIASEAVDTSGYSPETPGPNGETFSTSRAVPADASNVVQMPDGARLVGPTTFSISPGDSKPVENASDAAASRSASESKVLADFVKSPPFESKGLSGLDVPSQRAMMLGVFRVGHDLKVLDSVVDLIPIDVMDMLRSEQLTPEMLFNNQAVFEKLFVPNRDGSITQGSESASALLRAVALGTAKSSARDFTGAALNDNSTNGAGDFHILKQTRNAAGNQTFSLTVYHGTPHKVDRFRTDKIGTGEGAQAYGWGLYFAESRDVGEQYRKQLNPNAFYVTKERNGGYSVNFSDNRPKVEGFGSLSEANKWASENAQNTGNLYTVELLPDESEFLDWDKPLSEQSEKVRIAMERLKLALIDSKEIANLWENQDSKGYSYRAQSIVWNSKQGYVTNQGSFPTLESAKAAIDEFRKSNPVNMTGSEAYRRGKNFGITPKDVSESMLKSGIKGIRYLDGNSRTDGEGTYNYVIFDESLVKIIAENGKPVETFSLGKVTPAQDADYLAAVEAGDMEKAQQMVDEAAKKAGVILESPTVGKSPILSASSDPDAKPFKFYQGFRYEPGKHPGFTYRKGAVKNLADRSIGFYLSGDQEHAEEYSKKILKDDERIGETRSLYVKSKNPFKFYVENLTGRQLIETLERGGVKIPDDVRDRWTWVYTNGLSHESKIWKWINADHMNRGEAFNDSLRNAFIAAGYDSIMHPDSSGILWGLPEPVMAIAVFSPNQIKSADPVTRDDAGNVIPLSQRFNPADNRITFSIRPGDFSARMEAKFSLFQAKPELRLAITQVAKERALRLGAEWIANGDVIRSAKDIGKEARMREALAYEARMNEYLDGLSENARQTLEFEPSALEDDPLVAAMLDFGKLMSFTTAKKSGKVEAKSGDYDGQPWLPPAWFSKGAGIMPDQMAQAMSDQGLIPDAYTDTLWAELGKRIEATRKDKAAHREAVQAYKAAEKYARDASRAEADQWAENAKKQAGSPKAQRDAISGAARTLEGILAAAPPEVRARAGGYLFSRMAKLATDEARLRLIEDTIDKLNVELEKYLKKEYRQQIAKLFKRYAPKKDDKGRITSNITADAAEEIGFAFDFASLDDANQEKEMAALEKTLEESEDSTEIQDAIGKIAIVQLFYKLEERESSELEAAAMWLKDVGGGAREARKIIDAARAEAVKEAKNEAKKDASNGKLSSLPDAENVEADVRSSTFKRFTNDVKGFLNSALFTMGQQLEIVFGQDSRITTEFHRRAVRAANDSTDIKRDIEARRLAFVEKLFGTTSRIKQAGRMGALTVPTASGVMIEAGGKITTIEVPAEIVLRIIEGTADLKALGFTSKEASTLADAWADNEALPVKRQKRVFKIERRSDGKKTELTMSQDEAIQYFLWSNQKASREQMERDGWSKESFQQLNAFLSDDAKALAGFFADEYARLGRLIEPVYRRMFHAPFPRVTNYSPIFRDISSADSIIDIDQQGHGSGVSSGFILARNKNARSALRRTSAISAFMQHAQSAAHWIAHVELVRDLRSVLIDKEVQNAIRSNGRTAAANGIKKRVMQLENQGKVGAAGIAELDSWGSRLLQARAFKGLAWRISPVMKQASAYFNPLLADVPAWDYMRGTARLLSGQLDVSAMWNSPDIQRRIEMGFSAESRIAMDKLGYTGSTLLAAMGKGMLPMTLMDAGWTTAGAAIAFDYYRRNNVKSGMNEAQAESAALDQLEMMIAQSAQPADAVNRSLIEGIQNPWLKSMWMFASESRKTLAVEIMALRRLATGKSKNKAMDVQRAVVAHVVMAATTQLMAGILSLLMGDDDDREREWSVEEWASAIVAGPINGLFLFGDAFNYVGRRLFGLHAFEPSTAIGQAVKTVSSAPVNLDKVINGEPEEQRKAFLRLGEAVGQAASLVGPGNPFTATDVILGNPLKDAEKILTRLTD